MDKQTRLEIDVINSRLLHLGKILDKLQELVQEHREKIETLQKPLRDPAHVQPLS